jgi:hypothetical protein
MIFFVTPTDEAWTMEAYLQQDGRPLSGRIRTLTYDAIVAQRRLALGTYVFAALDQLTPTEIEIGVRCWQELSNASAGVKLFNDPTRVLLRRRLLETCFSLGRNTFRVRRASEFLRRQCFPVFIRPSHEHGGSLSPVLRNRRQLMQALAKAMLWGFRLRDLIIVEYCHTADSSGVFREYCASIVGDTIIPQSLIVSRNWITKWGNRIINAETSQEERDYVVGNPHADWLRQTFQLANIGYGRIDYGIKNGAPQVWEINTNPTIAGRPGRPGRATADERSLLALTREGFRREFQAAWEGIDSAVDPGRTIRIDVSPRQLRRLRAESRLRARLRARTTVISRMAYPPIRRLYGYLGRR